MVSLHSKTTRCSGEPVTKGEQNSSISRATLIKRTLWTSHFPPYFLINKCHLHRSLFSDINRRNYTCLIKWLVIQLANRGRRAIDAVGKGECIQFNYSALHRLRNRKNGAGDFFISQRRKHKINATDPWDTTIEHSQKN